MLNNKQIKCIMCVLLIITIIYIVDKLLWHNNHGKMELMINVELL